MKECPRCGRNCSDNEAFCRDCGHSFAQHGQTYVGTGRRQVGEFEPTIPALHDGPGDKLYNRPPQGNLRKILLIVVSIIVVLLIVGALILGINIGKGGATATKATGNTPTVGSVPTSGNTPVQVNTTTAAIPSPTSPPPTPTPTPTPIPYSVAKTGDVCKPPYSQFQASGWVAEKNSFVFTGNGSNVVISPCTITTPNYAVTATITLFKGQLGVGVIAHADSGGQNGYAGGAGCRNISFGRCGFFINDHFGDIMDIDQENENLSGQTHTYKLVVNEVTLQLFYDNSTIPIVTKSLATFPQAGYAGFECYDQCQVTGFIVTGI